MKNCLIEGWGPHRRHIASNPGKTDCQRFTQPCGTQFAANEQQLRAGGGSEEHEPCMGFTADIE
ncbi:hypothetical protein [Caballeronia concitans]|uniref:hypothetical protein n=1 Tax=Caballeronia concitans TaxID=1777133 RepID=UPI000B358EF4|nr:hypothetical protein [Caballeronia concitans]